MHGIKGILFDNDGTLVDTRDLIFESFKYATQQVMGRPVTDEEIEATGGQPLDTQMLMLAGGNVSLGEKLTDVYREYNHAIHDERIALFDGVADGLAQLAANGYVFGVVTSKRHWLAERGLKLTGVIDRFGCLIGADDCEHHKPHPAPLLMAARELGLDASQCAYAGDSPFDIRAAKTAGFTSIAALWGMFGEDALRAEDPDLACSSFADLVEHFI